MHNAAEWGLSPVAFFVHLFICLFLLFFLFLWIKYLLTTVMTECLRQCYFYFSCACPEQIGSRNYMHFCPHVFVDVFLCVAGK